MNRRTLVGLAAATAAQRMGAKTLEVKAGEGSLISQPATIANLILEAAG